MRRALALAAAVVSARQDHLCAEDVCFYHVPKTGGDSFKYLLRDELKAHGRTFWSNEWCPTRSNGCHLYYGLPRRRAAGDVAVFECHVPVRLSEERPRTTARLRSLMERSR